MRHLVSDIREMEGGEDEERELFRRFEHLRYTDRFYFGRHVFLGGPELLDFMRERTVPWKRREAKALGMHREKRPMVAASPGLAGRLKARRK
jgi:hypothetical protein